MDRFKVPIFLLGNSTSLITNVCNLNSIKKRKKRFIPIKMQTETILELLLQELQQPFVVINFALFFHFF